MDFGSHDPLIGRRLRGGDLELLSPLGAGGMGRVYRGFSQANRRPVAVKVLGLAAQSPAALARLRREVSATQRIVHPNVVRIEELGVEPNDGLVFVVMELVEGVDVGRLIDERGPLPFPRACRIVLEVARALEAAHAAGVLHRDVKPGNVMLTRAATPSGVADGVKLVDFGLAKLAEPEATALTATGSTLGTMGFMPLEQLLGEELDVRADVFSVAATLYAMLTARIPYPPRELGALLRAMRLPPPSVPSVPPGLDALLQRTLSPDRASRPATMAQLAEALVPFCDDAAAAPQAVPFGEAPPVFELDLDRASPAARQAVEARAAGAPPVAQTVDIRAARPVAEVAEPPPPPFERAQLPGWVWPVVVAVLGAALIGALRLGGALQRGSLEGRITRELALGKVREATAIYFREYAEARKDKQVEALLPALFAGWAASHDAAQLDAEFLLSPSTFTGSMHGRAFELSVERVQGSAFSGSLTWLGIQTQSGLLTTRVMGLHRGNQVIFVDEPTRNEQLPVFVLNGVKEGVIVRTASGKVALIGTASPYAFVMIALRNSWSAGMTPEAHVETVPVDPDFNEAFEERPRR